MAFRDRHHGRVDEPQLEVCIARVDLGGTPEQPRRQVDDRMLPAGDRGEECARSMRADPGTKELIDLDQHEVGDEEVAPQLGDERGAERVSAVTPVRCGDERPGIADDLQRADTSSRKYFSAMRPRSSGPSPDAT